MSLDNLNKPKALSSEISCLGWEHLARKVKQKTLPQFLTIITCGVQGSQATKALCCSSK